jgi:hypothetical protein
MHAEARARRALWLLEHRSAQGRSNRNTIVQDPQLSAHLASAIGSGGEQAKGRGRVSHPSQRGVVSPDALCARC